MPTYEYRCKSCGHEFEIQQSFSDDPLRECPACAGELRKVFGNVGISFKGSGFYKTDHGSRSSSKATASSDSNGSSGDSSSSSSSSDSSSTKTEPAKTASTKSESAA